MIKELSGLNQQDLINLNGKLFSSSSGICFAFNAQARLHPDPQKPIMTFRRMNSQNMFFARRGINMKVNNADNWKSPKQS